MGNYEKYGSSKAIFLKDQEAKEWLLALARFSNEEWIRHHFGAGASACI
jgi:hypothetical protein